MMLTLYAIEEKEFKTAEKYLNNIDKMKKPSFSCGNEFNTYYARLKNLHKRRLTIYRKITPILFSLFTMKSMDFWGRCF